MILIFLSVLASLKFTKHTPHVQRYIFLNMENDIYNISLRDSSRGLYVYIFICQLFGVDQSYSPVKQVNLKQSLIKPTFISSILKLPST